MTARTGSLFATRDDLDLVRKAERLGYESVWAAEGQGKTAFGKLERWAVATEDIGLATGIVNVFSRTPAATAQAVATLDAHSGGRAILGLGVAHPGVVESFHGVEFDRPLARLAEYIRLVRRYLGGDPAGFEGEFFSPGRTSFWEAFNPERAEVPIYNAALGPRNVRLTGELADGWLPNLYPCEEFERGLEWLDEGLDRSGRDRDDIDTAMYVLVSVDDDRSTAREAAATHVARYFRDVPGYYDRVAAEVGFNEMVERVKTAPTANAAVDAVDDAFLDRIAVIGDAATVRSQLDDLRDGGVDLPIVRAPSGVNYEAVEAVLRAASPQ